MPTNLALDDKLIEEARKVGQHRTKKDAVTAALREYVKYRRQLAILALEGTMPSDCLSVGTSRVSCRFLVHCCNSTISPDLATITRLRP